jgi:hypothetical protein
MKTFRNLGWVLSVRPAIRPRKNHMAMISTTENKPGRFWRRPKQRTKALRSVL